MLHFRPLLSLILANSALLFFLSAFPRNSFGCKFLFKDLPPFKFLKLERGMREALYLDLGGGYMGIYICKNSSCVLKIFNMGSQLSQNQHSTAYNDLLIEGSQFN